MSKNKEDYRVTLFLIYGMAWEENLGLPLVIKEFPLMMILQVFHGSCAHIAALVPKKLNRGSGRFFWKSLRNYIALFPPILLYHDFIELLFIFFAKC